MSGVTRNRYLSFIGCGRAGRALGCLWRQQGTFQIGQVLTRSLDSARTAVSQVGAGEAVDDFSKLRQADVYLIATQDRELGAVAKRLAGSSLAGAETTVFHLSGAESSALFSDSGLSGPVASVHPLRSFGDFMESVSGFRGTWCGCEGDVAALDILRPAFEAIGGRTFDIPPERKLAYHAASVMVSNYLNALVASAIKAYGYAGIDADTATQLATPILRNTMENILQLGPQAALTGPIARGDRELVGRELDMLRAMDPELAEVYRLLGKRTLELAVEGGRLTSEDRESLDRIFGS